MSEQIPVQQPGSLEFVSSPNRRRYSRSLALGSLSLISAFGAINFDVNLAAANTPIVAPSPKLSEAPAVQTVSLIMPKFGDRDTCVWECPGTPSNANYTPADATADVKSIGFQVVNFTQKVSRILTGIATTTCEPDDKAFNFSEEDAADRSISSTGAEIVADYDDSGLQKYSLSLVACMAKAQTLRYSGNYPDPLNPGQTLGAINQTEWGNEVNLKRNYPASLTRYVRQVLAWSNGVYSVNPNAAVAGAVLAGTAPYSPIDFTRDYAKIYLKYAKTPPKFMDVHAYPAENEIDTPTYTLSNTITTVNGHTYSRIGDISIANLADYRRALDDDFGGGQDTRSETGIVVGEFAWFKNGDTNNGVIGVSEATQAKYYDQIYKKLTKDALNPVTNVGLWYADWFQLVSGVAGDWRSGPVSMSGPNNDQLPLVRSKLYYTMQKDLQSKPNPG